jgi:hypothetical protein
LVAEEGVSTVRILALKSGGSPLKQKPFEKVRRVKEKRDGMEEMRF